jgi:membrane protease YdiL (CAAX protease family)
MNNITHQVRDIIVLLIIALPPFLYLYRYIHENVDSTVLQIITYLLYWVGTISLANLVPSITVLFLIIESRQEKADTREDASEYENKRFKLNYSDDKWKFSIKTFIYISLISIVLKVLISVLNYLVIILIENFTKVNLQNQEVVNEFLQANIWLSIFYFIIIVFCAPIVEEFVFRYWIYDRVLKSKLNYIWSAVLSSLLFMIAHFNIQGAFAFFLVGVTNCYLYEKKGYWAAVANHFMFNFSTAIILISLKVFDVPII